MQVKGLHDCKSHKMLEREQQLVFRWKTTRQAFPKIVSTQNQQKKVPGDTFSMQLLHLANCNYGNGSMSWMVNVAICLSIFEPLTW